MSRRAPVSGRRRAGAALIALAAVLALVSCTHGSDGSKPVATAAPASPTRPNIVFVLTDDLSTNLLPYMPHVEALARAGMSFSNYTVTDSACCPSRASILTGGFPHTTKIYRNRGPDGGFVTFHDRDEAANTFAAMVHTAGYRTAFMGKYLNHYYPNYPAPKFLSTWTPPEATYVPAGWDEWDGVGYGYNQYNYDLNDNHSVGHYGHQPGDYLNTVLQAKAESYIGSSATQRRPFLLEVASFTPHSPATPAPQDLHKFSTVTAPRGPAYDKLPANAPPWLSPRAPLTAATERSIDVAFRKRVQSVQSVDRMVGALEAKLRATGQAANTVFVFSSDNGYHMGDYRLKPGKFTAFDTDIKVPLIVTGPGIAAATTNADVTENIDLAPTFEQLAGAKEGKEVDGHSLVPLLHGEHPPWRNLALVEHHGPVTDPHDPDVQTRASGNPPTYAAIRSPDFTYVHYDNGEREYYDRDTDPAELDNLAPSLSAARIAQLEAMVSAMRSCHGAQQCWAAARPSQG